MADSKRPDLPEYLKRFRTLRVTRQPANTREQSLEKDVAYGVNSIDDLVREVAKRFPADKGPLKK